jgi:hypothetical protein
LPLLLLASSSSRTPAMTMISAFQLRHPPHRSSSSSSSSPRGYHHSAKNDARGRRSRTHHLDASSSGGGSETRRKKKSSAATSPGPGGGGGFGGGKGEQAGGGGGGASSSSNDNRPTKKKSVRTVSGHAGSGTRVLSAAANCFDRIRKMHGKDATTDVYVRSPSNDERTFWFVGKVIRMVDVFANDGDGDDGDGDGGASSKSKKSKSSLAGTVYPTVSEAMISQKRLIFEYAKSELRPRNLGGAHSVDLELWTAPGDSEMDVVRNKVALDRVVGSMKDIRDGFDVNDVGYNPEVRERDDDDVL